MLRPLNHGLLQGVGRETFGLSSDHAANSSSSLVSNRDPETHICRVRQALCSDCGCWWAGAPIRRTLPLLSAPGMLWAANGTEPTPRDSHIHGRNNGSLAGLLVLHMPKPAWSSHGPSEMGMNDRRGQEATQGQVGGPGVWSTR